MVFHDFDLEGQEPRPAAEQIDQGFAALIGDINQGQIMVSLGGAIVNRIVPSSRECNQLSEGGKRLASEFFDLHSTVRWRLTNWAIKSTRLPSQAMARASGNEAAARSASARPGGNSTNSRAPSSNISRVASCHRTGCATLLTKS